MKAPASKKVWASILFPVTLLVVNVAALAKSPANTFELVLGVSIGLGICGGGLWFVLWNMGKKKKLLLPMLNAARADGVTAYLYMVKSDLGLVTVDTRRELKLFAVKKGKVVLRMTAPADTYALGIKPYSVNATMVVDGLSLEASAQPGAGLHGSSGRTSPDVTMMLVPEARTRDEKSFRAQANQALIRASVNPMTSNYR